MPPIFLALWCLSITRNALHAFRWQYRRVFLVGVLPLLSTLSSRRAALGVVVSLCSAVVYREVEPFINPTTNLLAHVAQ